MYYFFFIIIIMCNDLDYQGSALKIVTLLAAQGRWLDRAQSDGNCLFWSLSKQLFESDKYHSNPRMISSEYAASCPDLFSSWTIQDLSLQEHVHMEDDKSVGKTIAKLNVLEGDGERRLNIFRVGSTISGGGGGGEQRKFETNYQSKFFFNL